jgi:hypothetical protein
MHNGELWNISCLEGLHEPAVVFFVKVEGHNRYFIICWLESTIAILNHYQLPRLKESLYPIL